MSWQPDLAFWHISRHGLSVDDWESGSRCRRCLCTVAGCWCPEARIAPSPLGWCAASRASAETDWSARCQERPDCQAIGEKQLQVLQKCEVMSRSHQLKYNEIVNYWKNDSKLKIREINPYHLAIH
ncbi:hypothetical protein BpHYR1_002401 [Brachionus plicatilis]|uniref:Uncharacterized protein n=1 Tax=Brachionus plicatilis TaxID=10195 RepID=A0A3M7RAM4_BRAPC|nr:hypothetical protein BpHYR1_002401 [Brachionus plicatilis]